MRAYAARLVLALLPPLAGCALDVDKLVGSCETIPAEPLASFQDEASAAFCEFEARCLAEQGHDDAYIADAMAGCEAATPFRDRCPTTCLESEAAECIAALPAWTTCPTAEVAEVDMPDACEAIPPCEGAAR